MLLMIRFCHMMKEEHERHPMNQNILINHGMYKYNKYLLYKLNYVVDVCDICYVRERVRCNARFRLRVCVQKSQKVNNKF